MEYIKKFSFLLTRPTEAEKVVSNPFKHVSIVETNCLAKAAMAAVAGGGMGFAMALFMNAMEMRDLELGRTKQSTRYTLRRDYNKMLSMGKGFAYFGAFFCLFECAMEKIRIKDDSINSFFSGMFTSMIVAAEALGPKGLFFSGLGGGAFGMVMYKLQMTYMTH